MAAAEYGWICGCPDGLFEPQKLVSRSETAVILNRMLDRSCDPDFLETHAVRQFPDVPATHWAYEEICEGANPHRYQRVDGQGVWEGLM